MYTIGNNPTRIYSSDDIVRGIGPGAGTVGMTNNGKIYKMCVIAASQNLTDGMLCTLGAIGANGNTATVAAAGPPAQNSAQQLGVYTASVTGSASQYAWFQIFGPCSVLATASTLPYVSLTMSAGAGAVDDAVATASGIIDGLHLTVTTAATGLTAAMLNWPRFVPPGQAG